MKLSKGKLGIQYKVIEINGTEETVRFLQGLGLEVGDTVTIISKLAGNYIVNIKDSRYGIDSRVAKLIVVE